MKRTMLNLDDDQYEWLRREAYLRNKSMSEILREIIEAAMKEKSDVQKDQ
jgi:predicted CopG family antitoxin